MLDTDLLIGALREKGHEVGPVFPVPENAGDYEFTVDGDVLTLEQVRALLAAEQK